MDSTTLAAVIIIFLLCLGLYFATAPPLSHGPKTPHASADGAESAEVQPKPQLQHPLLSVRPAVLRHNVAVSRLLR